MPNWLWEQRAVTLGRMGCAQKKIEPTLSGRSMRLSPHGDRKSTELWRRGQGGWPRRFPIAQFPNQPLLIAFAGWGLAALSSGTAHEVGRAIFTLGLAVWACGEAIGGVNWFRRLLGVGALVWIIANLAADL
jgi:hypothetical protein